MDGALLVTGSRTIRDVDLVSRELDRLVAKHGITPTLLLSGHAVGVDRAAEAWASKRGIEIKPYIPDWEGRGISAGHVRNQEMVDDAQWVIAFWDGKSRGTLGAINAAKKKGIWLETVELKVQ